MILRVLLFSVLQDAVGSEEVEVEVPRNGCDVNGLLRIVYDSWPELLGWNSVIRVAVDHDYVERNYQLKEGQIIALMPPMQGG